VLSPRGGRVERTFALSVREGLDPGLLRAEAEPQGLDVDLQPAGDRFYRAVVRWEGTHTPEAKIIFTLGDERIEMPVEWTNATLKEIGTAP
jgi:hypothetical protein